MGNSTIRLQDVIDWTKAKGIPVPTDQPSGYGSGLAVKIGNDAMSDFVAERFNHKWNRSTATPFYTNSYQQDYPQVGLVDIGWLEDCDRVDINNTSLPKPTVQLTCRRQLSRSSYAGRPVGEICWMYNSELYYASWPGPGKTYSPLVTTGPVVQNPLMNIVDPNGNLMIVTGFGTTSAAVGQSVAFTKAQRIALTSPAQGVVTLFGAGNSVPAFLVGSVNFTVACSDPRFSGTFPIISNGLTTIGGNPFWFITYAMFGAGKISTIAQENVTGTITIYTGPMLPTGTVEGTSVVDGTVVWTVVDPESQGFRVGPIPGGSGPVWQITPYYQMKLQALTALNSLINPIPDEYARVFQVGYEAYCLQSSPNPNDRKEGIEKHQEWLRSLDKSKKQGDREADAYGMIPESSPVERVYGQLRNPQDPSQPY